MRRPIALLVAISLAGAGCTAARHPADAMTATPAGTDATGADMSAVPGDATAGASRHPPAAIVLVGVAIAIGVLALAISQHESSSSFDFVPLSPS